METQKIGFFKRVKMAIFNLEKYSIFANEKFSKALKYLLLLIVIVTLFLAAASTINLSKEIGKFIDFVKSEEFPEFELKDGKLDSKTKLNSYDEEYNGRLIIDTTEDLPKETLEQYKKLGKEATYTAILLNDKVVYRFDETSEGWLETTYNNITSTLGISEISKDKLVKDILSKDSLSKYEIVLYVYAFITVFLMNVLSLLEDVIIIGVFGWIASKIARVSLGFVKSMSLAIYSLTLSIILSTIYSIVFSFTGFEIKYFEVMYMIIAYIYMVASIMMMKEGNKTAGEAVTVEGEVLKTSEDKEEEKPEEEEPKDKDKKLPEKEDKDEKKKLPEKKEKDKEEIPEEQGKNDLKKDENSKGE